MRTTKLSLLLLSGIMFLLFLIPAMPDNGIQAQNNDYQTQVTALFKSRCAKCHGPDSFAAGGMNYILDTAMLIENGVIKPGLPKQSKLFEEVEEGKMPADGTAPLPDTDIELIANWITSLAPDVATVVEEKVTVVEETTGPDEGSGLIAWLGKFHPLMVHFPIALILIAGFFELLSVAGGAFPFIPMRDGRTGFTTAARLCIFFGALFGVIAAALGWFNAADHFFSANLQEDLFWHRWLGTVVAAISMLALIFSEIHHRALERGESSGSAGSLYRVLLFVGCVLIIIVGHLGGTLVFGEGYYAF